MAEVSLAHFYPELIHTNSFVIGPAVIKHTHQTHTFLKTHPLIHPSPTLSALRSEQGKPGLGASQLFRLIGYTSATRPRSETRVTTETPYLERVQYRSEQGKPWPGPPPWSAVIFLDLPLVLADDHVTVN